MNKACFFTLNCTARRSISSDPTTTRLPRAPGQAGRESRIIRLSGPVSIDFGFFIILANCAHHAHH